MMFSSFSKWLGAGVVAASLAVIPLTLPAEAQDTAPGTTTEPNAVAEPPNPLPDNTNRDDNNDLGWFGLIGLAGLAGLAARKRHETVHTHQVSNDPDVRVRSESNYR